MDRDPVLIGGAEGFPIELVLLFFIMLGIIGLVYWLSRALGQREDEKSREARREAIAAEASARPPGLLRLERGEDGAWLIYVNGERYPRWTRCPIPTHARRSSPRCANWCSSHAITSRSDQIRRERRKRKATAPVQKPQERRKQGRPKRLLHPRRQLRRQSQSRRQHRSQRRKRHHLHPPRGNRANSRRSKRRRPCVAWRHSRPAPSAAPRIDNRSYPRRRGCPQ